MEHYDKAGFLLMREGRVLLCRKKHTTSLLILPGGTRERGESYEDCLTRELMEELGTSPASSVTRIGGYDSRAAGNAGKTVHIELFLGELMDEPRAASEIRELVWFGSGDDWALLAPSLREAIFPDLILRKLLPWT
jgi:8-oxo-dGTP pyrophosphatase MutT (NUDIX family)